MALAVMASAGMPVVLQAISASSSMHPDSLDAVSPHSDAPSIGEVLACPETPLERLEELACLRDAIQDLDPADRELLYRRYFCEETQVQLGKRLGMSQMQVSRRLARVLVALQRRLEDSAIPEPGNERQANTARGIAGHGARMAPMTGASLRTAHGLDSPAPSGRSAARRGATRAGTR